MIRINALALSGALALFALVFGAASVTAAPDKTDKTKTKADSKKTDKKKDTKAPEGKGGGKPVQIASFGDWGAFLAQSGKEKTCYALASPKERVPPGLQRDSAYVFISSRPAENVRNEVSVIMGFPMKDGSQARADIGSAGFDLVAKGTNAWVKNPAEEAQFIDAMKKNAKLVVKASSIKGHATTDTYSLAGFSQTLERVLKECQ
jgi:hypothetical protein